MFNHEHNITCVWASCIHDILLLVFFSSERRNKTLRDLREVFDLNEASLGIVLCLVQDLQPGLATEFLQ